MQKLYISDSFFASRTAKPACRTPSSRDPDPGIARGMDLGRPPHGHVVLCQGHKIMWAQSSNKFPWQTALATGTSVWSRFPKVSLSRDDPRARCQCGLALPLRPNLLWTCPLMQYLRGPGRDPCDRAEERLFAAVLDPAQYVSDVAAAITDRATQTQEVIIATDGSSKQAISGFAICGSGLRQLLRWYAP